MPTSKTTTTKKTTVGTTAEQAKENLLQSLIHAMANTIYSSLENAKAHWRNADEIAQQSYDKLEWLMEQLAHQISVSKWDLTKYVIHHYHEPYYYKRHDWWSTPSPYKPAIWCVSNSDVAQVNQDYRNNNLHTSSNAKNAIGKFEDYSIQPEQYKGKSADYFLSALGMDYSKQPGQ